MYKKMNSDRDDDDGNAVVDVDKKQKLSTRGGGRSEQDDARNNARNNATSKNPSLNNNDDNDIDDSNNDKHDDNNPNSYYYAILSWVIYIILLVIRICVGPWLTGYIHPDEFFQGGQELYFGCGRGSGVGDDNNNDLSFLPWEYQPQHALRSIVPPTIMTYVPLAVYKYCRHYVWNILRSNLINNHNEESTNGLMSGIEVLVIPRIACSILSIFLVDRTVWILSKTSSSSNTSQSKSSSSSLSSVPIPVLLLASSWTTIVVLNRPFSNSMECCVVSCLLLHILRRSKKSSSTTTTSTQQQTSSAGESVTSLSSIIKEYGLIGIYVAIGLFTRFTFVFFVIPVLIHCFFTDILQLGQQQSRQGIINNNDDKEELVGRRKTTSSHYWPEAFLKIGTAAIFFFLVSCFIVSCDSSFYHSLTKGSFFFNGDTTTTTTTTTSSTIRTTDPITTMKLKLQITPWNAFSYNSKVSNLQDHGLHPRYTHALVNMLLLYGPATIIVYLSILHYLVSFVKAKLSGKSRSNNNSKPLHTDSTIITVCQWTVVVGLGVLSIAPHQEPRFLLPLLVPIVLIVGQVINNTSHVTTSRRTIAIGAMIWIIFNIILFVLFGILHQGGIVSSLLKAGSAQPSNLTTETIDANDVVNVNSKMIYFHTYMPPTFLTRFATTSTKDAQSTCLWVEGGDETINKDSDGSCVSSNMKRDFGCSHALQIIDLKGSSWYELSHALQEELTCPSNGSEPTSIRLVIPPMSSFNEDTGIWSFTPTGCEIPIPGFRCQVVERHQPHLTTEDFPPLPALKFDTLGLSAIPLFLFKVWDNMSLNVYEISRDCIVT